MGLKFNPLTGQLDLVNSQTATTGDVYNTNNLQVDQSGGTSDTYGSLAGTINGSNTTFTVSNAEYAAGTLIVSLNGQVLTQGTSEDWVEALSGSGTFDFNTAPETGDEITASYMTAVASGSSQNLFIQETTPTTSEDVYQWWETDGAGSLVTLWVETNGA